MKNNKKNIILIIILVVILLIFFYFLVINSKQDGNTTNSDIMITKDISKVTDNSRFFTVSSCVSKYLTYLSSNDINNLLLLLNSEYKEKNNISNYNIYNYVGQLSGEQEFTARKMYQEKLNDNIIKYYVFGYIKPVTMSETIEESFEINSKEYYLIVYLDLRQQLFSIEPYNGEIFFDGGVS